MEPVQTPFKKTLVYALLVVFLIIFWNWISSPMLLAVNGVGEVSVPATSATVSFSLSSNDATAQGASMGIRAKIESLKALLKTSGISEEDISESQMQLVPAGMVSVGQTGFQASVTMSAKTIHVADMGNLISSLYSAGATVVSQPTLLVEKKETLEQKAMDSALADAKKQATRLALKNWKFIKKIASVSYQSSGSTSTSSSKADAVTEASSIEAAQNGVFKIVSVASVTYKLW